MASLKARRARCDLQDYRNAAYIAADLDERVFDMLNEGDDTSFLYRHGALDALDILPAGSMTSSDGGLYDRATVTRGVSLLEQQAIDAWMKVIFREMAHELA